MNREKYINAMKKMQNFSLLSLLSPTRRKDSRIIILIIIHEA